VSEIQGVDSFAETAFRRHYVQVYRFVRRRTSSREDAEDVAQAVFEDAMAGLERFTIGASPVLAWLYTVAGRRLADEARLRERRPISVSLEDAAIDRGASSEYGLEIASLLRKAIAELPSDQQQVVVMKLLQGRRYAEIADRLGTSEEACRMRLSRALRKLRETLANEEVSP
jgi:RNA polymerase sigma-70 factor (ECF subfamily)